MKQRTSFAHFFPEAAAEVEQAASAAPAALGTVKTWLSSPEGRAAIANGIAGAQSDIAKLNKARAVDPAKLNIPLDASAEPKGFDAEFLSKRLARVAKLAGVSMPDGTHEQIAEVAGTILGQIARTMEAASAAPQTLVINDAGNELAIKRREDGKFELDRSAIASAAPVVLVDYLQENFSIGRELAEHHAARIAAKT